MEMYQFEVDLGEVGISMYSEAGYRQLKAQAVDKARSILDLALVEEPGRAMKMQLDYAGQNYVPQDQRDNMVAGLLRYCVKKLEDACRLTPEKRMELATAIDNEA